jgi:hypothetical protein
MKNKKIFLIVLLSIFSLVAEAQRGLVLFGSFFRNRNEGSFTRSAFILAADTTQITTRHEDYTVRSISLPDIAYMKLDGKHLKAFTFGGYFSHSIENRSFSNEERNLDIAIYFSRAEYYNYLRFFDDKLKFYIGGKLSSYWGRGRFFNSQFETSLGVSAYTNITYLHKKRYWFELGLGKSLAGAALIIPTTIRQTRFRFNNHLGEAFYPISIGFGLLF